MEASGGDGMKIKTSELNGAALDWAVAKCEGLVAEHGLTELQIFYGARAGGCHRYATDPAQAHPIMEREITKLFKNVGGTFSAQIRHEGDHPLVSHKVLQGWTNASGPTMLVAAMRCYVASKLGDEIDVPEELL